MANKDFMDPELTEEEKEDMIIKNEEDYLEGLLAAADDAANDIKKIDIMNESISPSEFIRCPMKC